MGTIKTKAKNVSPGARLVIGGDGQIAKVTKTRNTGTSVTIETPVSIRNCPPNELVEVVVGGE